MEVITKDKLLMNHYMELESYLLANMIIIKDNEKMEFLKAKKIKLFIIMEIDIKDNELIINK